MSLEFATADRIRLSDMHFAKLMREVPELDPSDVEAQHIRADWLLCQILETIGYEETVSAFNDLKKWYA